jgi:hypothetical protein
MVKRSVDCHPAGGGLYSRLETTVVVASVLVEAFMKRLFLLLAVAALAGCASVVHQPGPVDADTYHVDASIEYIEVFNGHPPQ